MTTSPFQILLVSEVLPPPRIVLDKYGNYLVTITTVFLGFTDKGSILPLYTYSTQPDGGGQTESFSAAGFNEYPYIYGPISHTFYNGNALLEVQSSAGGNIPVYALPGGQATSIVPIAYADPAPPGHVSAIPDSVLGPVWSAPLSLMTSQLIDYVKAMLHG